MPQPLTRINELIDTMRSLALQSAHYVNRLSFEAASIRRQIEEVMRIDAGQGWILFGIWYAIVGDESSARSAFQSALRLTDDEDVHINLSGILTILGYFSEAQAQLVPFLRVESGRLYGNMDRGCRLGMFNLISNQLAIAEEQKMQLPTQAINAIEAVKTASHIMRDARLTDADIGTHLDMVGEVLRRRQMPVPGISYQAVNVPEVYVGITMQAHVPTDPATVFEMNVELVQLMQEKGLKMHERFAVLFGGPLQ